VNVFECSSCVGIAVCSPVAAWLGYSWFGIVGAVLAFPLGVLVGWLVPPLLVLTVFIGGVLFEEGPKGLRDLLRTGKDGPGPPSP
jgi:hypothetical protein